MQLNRARLCKHPPLRNFTYIFTYNVSLLHVLHPEQLCARFDSAVGMYGQGQWVTRPWHRRSKIQHGSYIPAASHCILHIRQDNKTTTTRPARKLYRISFMSPQNLISILVVHGLQTFPDPTYSEETGCYTQHAAKSVWEGVHKRWWANHVSIMLHGQCQHFLMCEPVITRVNAASSYHHTPSPFTTHSSLRLSMEVAVSNKEFWAGRLN